MRRATILLALAMGASIAQAADVLTLQKFLDQVKSQNPAGRAAVENIASYDTRQREADVRLMPELYASYAKFDDKKPPPNPLQGDRIQGETWRAGLRKQFQYGLGADLYFNAQRTNISNASPMFLTVPNAMESSWAFALTQSLWRNGFGESTHAQYDADKAASEAGLLQSRFDLKNLMMGAENAYWAVVTYNEVVKLQQENVERARKLREYMNKRAQMKLFDDVDALQTQANFEARELELQKSLDDRAQAIRQLNTLRGLASDDIEAVEALPPKDMMDEVVINAKTTPMTREDFQMLRAKAQEGLAKAKYARSQINPQLDVFASYATNGRDGVTGDSYYQAGTDRYPTWKIGVNFSIPLDFGLILDLRRGFSRAQNAAAAAKEKAELDEVRVWDDLVKQKKDAKGRFERARRIESLQTEIVKRERTRLINGRTTTFQALKLEQEMAAAQIGRAKAQLDLLTIHNAIKTFEARK